MAGRFPAMCAFGERRGFFRLRNVKLAFKAAFCAVWNKKTPGLRRCGGRPGGRWAMGDYRSVVVATLVESTVHTLLST